MRNLRDNIEKQEVVMTRNPGISKGCFYFLFSFFVVALPAYGFSPVLFNVHTQKTVHENGNVPPEIKSATLKKVKDYEQSGWQSVHLLNNWIESYLEDKELYEGFGQSEVIDSAYGEHSYLLKSGLVSVIGGNFGFCHQQAIKDIVKESITT